MNVLDIAVLAVVLLSALIAFARGFVRELLSVAGWVVAAFVTLYTFKLVQPYARKLIPHELIADISGALVVFLVTLIVFSVASGPLARRIHETSFKPLDRSLGFVFGALRGLVLVSLAYLLVNWALKPEEQPKWIQEARSIPVLAYGAKVLIGLVPQDFLKGAQVGVNEINERAAKTVNRERAIRRLLTPPKPKANGGGSGSSGSGGTTQ